MKDKVVFERRIEKEGDFIYVRFELCGCSMLSSISEWLENCFFYLTKEERRDCFEKMLEKYVKTPLKEKAEEYDLDILDISLCFRIPKEKANKKIIDDFTKQYKIMLKKTIKKLNDLNKKRREELEDVVEGEDKIEIEYDKNADKITFYKTYDTEEFKYILIRFSINQFSKGCNLEDYVAEELVDTFYYLDKYEIIEYFEKKISDYKKELKEKIKEYNIYVYYESLCFRIPKEKANREIVEDFINQYKNMLKETINGLYDLHKKRREELKDLIEGDEIIEIGINR